MFCCDLAFGIQLNAARNLAPVQNIPSTLQPVEGWGWHFFHVPLLLPINASTRPGMINAGYTDTTLVWSVMGYTPWKGTNTMVSARWGTVDAVPLTWVQVTDETTGIRIQIPPLDTIFRYLNLPQVLTTHFLK